MDFIVPLKHLLSTIQLAAAFVGDNPSQPGLRDIFLKVEPDSVTVISHDGNNQFIDGLDSRLIGVFKPGIMALPALSVQTYLEGLLSISPYCDVRLMEDDRGNLIIHNGLMSDHFDRQDEREGIFAAVDPSGYIRPSFETGELLAVKVKLDNLLKAIKYTIFSTGESSTNPLVECLDFHFHPQEVTVTAIREEGMALYTVPIPARPGNEVHAMLHSGDALKLQQFLGMLVKHLPVNKAVDEEADSLSLYLSPNGSRLMLRYDDLVAAFNLRAIKPHPIAMYLNNVTKLNSQFVIERKTLLQNLLQITNGKSARSVNITLKRQGSDTRLELFAINDSGFQGSCTLFGKSATGVDAKLGISLSVFTEVLKSLPYDYLQITYSDARVACVQLVPVREDGSIIDGHLAILMPMTFVERPVAPAKAF